MRTSCWWIHARCHHPASNQQPTSKAPKREAACFIPLVLLYYSLRPAVDASVKVFPNNTRGGLIYAKFQTCPVITRQNRHKTAHRWSYLSQFGWDHGNKICTGTGGKKKHFPWKPAGNFPRREGPEKGRYSLFCHGIPISVEPPESFYEYSYWDISCLFVFVLYASREFFDVGFDHRTYLRFRPIAFLDVFFGFLAYS